MPLALLIFLQMAKIGLFAIGGGAVTIPFQQDLGESTGWFSTSQLADMLAVAQSLPGAMGVNLSAYVGYSQLGPGGALVAVLGSILPSIVIILVIANFLDRFHENRFVASVMTAIRPASLALLVCAVLLLFQMAFVNTDALVAPIADAGGAPVDGDGAAAWPALVEQLFNWKAIALFVVVVVATNLKPLKRVHPFFWMLACAIVGVVFAF